MKTLRQLSVASVFVFALAIPAFAGEIQTPLAPPPAQAPTTDGEIHTTLAGEIQIGRSESNASGSATDVALSLLQSVLSLF